MGNCIKLFLPCVAQRGSRCGFCRWRRRVRARTHHSTIAPGNTTNAQVYIQVIYMLYVMLYVAVVVVAIIVVVIYCSVGQAAQSLVARGSGRMLCRAHLQFTVQINWLRTGTRQQQQQWVTSAG